MGFFTDLKEDLSQAVSELLPEEDILELTEESEEMAEPELSESELSMAEPELTMAETELGMAEPELEMAEPELTMAEAELSMAEAELYTAETELPESELTRAEPELTMAEYDTLENAPASDTQAADMTFAEEPVTQDTSKPWDETADFDDGLPIDIDEMLDKAEEMTMMKEVNEMMEEPVYVAAAEAEMMKSDLPDKKVSDETATITAGMKLVGDITSEGSLELEGIIHGNIDILGKLNITGSIVGDSQAAEIFADNAKITGEMKSNGSVKIGQSTVIIGNIFANSAVIAGAVKGDIDVQGPVILDTSAIVMGNIKSKSVQINNGAVIEGMCSQCYAEVNPTSFFEEFKKGKK